MALYYPAAACGVCRQPIGTEESNILSFDLIEIPERDFQHFGAGLAHISCLSNWDRGDEFMEVWNRALDEYYLGKRLYRGVDGRVTYTDRATWVIRQCDTELRRRKMDLSSRMQAARDKAIDLGMASADNVDRVLHDLSAKEFRLHFGEFGVSRAFFKV